MSVYDLNSLEPLDPEWVEKRLSTYPFVQVDGVTNLRTLGYYPVSKGSGEGSGTMTRPHQLFRSAEVSGITDNGMTQLRELGVTKVFDLRSHTEIVKYNTPVPQIDGVEVVRVPVFEEEDYSPEVMARRFQLYASGKTEAFMELYSQILDNGGPAFTEILKHVRDRPEEGCLFHCTAGKDRTAVIAAILLSLAGVDDKAIASDYELTRVGREQVRNKILKRLAKEPIFAKNKDAALNMLTSRRETMLAFLDLLRDKYSSAEGYVQKFCGLSAEDVQTIRRNLVINTKV
ncbi:protein-tyrosine phosphatase-like protein [Phellopilus nigrolimitatus]|nr:protein-tyrosine phosphatase-like protein [Phellopilus nigrolimitatus]